MKSATKTATEFGFTINRDTLMEELTALSGVCEAKGTIPILSNILLEVDSGALHLSATNLHLSMQTQCPIGLISTPGAVCVPGKKLIEITKSLPKGAEVEFNVTDSCAIKSDRSRFKLPVMSKDDFPEIKESGGNYIALQSGLWQIMVNRVVFAITNDESRYALNGLKCILVDGSIKLVSTDGHRLAYVENTISSDISIDTLIPKKAVTESAKLCEGAKEIEFAVDGEQVFWKVGHRILSSRTLSGQFPNYELVLPKDNANVVTVDAEKFIDSLRRVSLMADERSRAIKLVVHEGSINIAAQSSENGEASDVIGAEYKDAEITAGFNAQYLIEAASAISTKEIAVRFKDGNSSVEINPVGETGMLTRMVVMPMRI